MNLKDRIDGEFKRLARTPQQKDRKMTVDTENGRIEVEVNDVNPLACSLDRLTYKSARLSDAPFDRLKDVSGQLRQRLTYLLEPLATIEADDQLQTVQMRSCPPRRDDGGVSYYELEVRPDEISLCRYQRSAKHPRHVTPTTLTRETLYRVAEDFAALT